MAIRTDDLITQIQNRPCLWNVNVDEYYNKVHRQQVWYGLAKTLYKDWENLKKDSKTKRVQCMKNKWKGLRTYYFREKSKELTLKNGTKRKRNTPLWNKLQFLSVVDSIPIGKRKDDNDTTILCPTKQREDPSLKQNEMPDFKKVFLKSIERNREDDPDKSFLLSLLPDMKSMNPNQNVNFRFEVMKIIKQIKYNDAVIQVEIKHEPPTEYEFYVETPPQFQV